MVTWSDCDTPAPVSDPDDQSIVESGEDLLCQIYSALKRYFEGDYRQALLPSPVSPEAGEGSDA